MTPTRADLSQVEDGVLIAAARAGDHDAFGELVTRHQRRVWRVCRQYVGGDEADATTQDALVKAFVRLPSFDGRAAFTTWLTRIAINTCLDELRRRRRRGLRAEPDDDGASDVLAGLADQAADPEARAVQRQALGRLLACERALPPRQRAIFRLRFFAGLELEEIAAALAVHVGTVKTQLHRAVHRMRRELGDVR